MPVALCAIRIPPSFPLNVEVLGPRRGPRPGIAVTLSNLPLLAGSVIALKFVCFDPLAASISSCPIYGELIERVSVLAYSGPNSLNALAIIGPARELPPTCVISSGRRALSPCVSALVMSFTKSTWLLTRSLFAVCPKFNNALATGLSCPTKCFKASPAINEKLPPQSLKKPERLLRASVREPGPKILYLERGRPMSNARGSSDVSALERGRAGPSESDGPVLASRLSLLRYGEPLSGTDGAPFGAPFGVSADCALAIAIP